MNTNNSILNSAFDSMKLNDPSNSEAVATLLDKFGLRWEVAKQPLLLPTGHETGFHGIVRTDTMETFSTCKDGYVPFQNSELAELLIRISEKTGYSIHSGGQFNGGGKVYLQLNSGNSIAEIGKDRTAVKGFVTGINSHDGTTSLKWGNANITISCQNTFMSASRVLKNKARHTASIHNRVEDSIREITGIVHAEQSLFDKFIRLSNTPVTKAHIEQVTKAVTGVDIKMSRAMAESQFSTYALNRSEELLSSISREMNGKGDTLWGLFSGVTHYTSHVLPVPKRDNARLESKYTGTALTIDNDVLDMVGKFVESAPFSFN
jgi:phage/plasmid-like protein (TIGR03299 family)